MDNLRVQIEKDLKDTLESEFGMSVELTSPDGDTFPAVGQVLYFTRELNPESGEAIVVNVPVVTLRKTSLKRIPRAGERWSIRMAVSPEAGADIVNFILTPDKNPESGTDIGFVRYYPQRLDSDSVTPDYEYERRYGVVS